MKHCCTVAFFALAGLFPAAAAPVVTYDLQSQSSAIERDVPVTFGAVFAPGDVPAGTSITVTDKSGNAIPTQVDMKAKHKDGSLRHAVVTISVPRLSSGRDTTVNAERGTPVQGAPISLAALPSDFDASVDLTVGENHLTVSVKDLLSHAKPEAWLSGPLVSEWWIAAALRDQNGKPDPHLSARFGIRSYGANRPLRIEVDVENDWTWAANPKTFAYDAEIRIGGKSVFTKQNIVQQAHTRWRQILWWSTPADVFVKQDLAYLKKTRVVPNFDTSSREAGIDQMYKIFNSKNRGPMGPGIISPAMPVTGGRADIGPLPSWTVAYLLTMDPRAAEMTMSAGDLSGGFQSHYRNERTGRPATSEEFPKISTHYNYVGRGNGNLPLPDTAGLWKGFTAESAHEPSLAFIPYLVTGERYYLEELQFWSQWNAWSTAPEYHGYGKGLIGWDQIRGQGWSLRTLAQAAYITPDNDPMKGTLLREMKANAEWYDANYTNNPNANIFHVALRATDNAKAVAPWMDDFLTWATQYAVQLGFDEFKAFARWKGYFPVQRMINPDYCYVMATKYYIGVMEAPHSFFKSWAEAYAGNIPPEDRNGRKLECGSDEMAQIFKMKRAGEMAGGGDSPGGYPAQMQPALAAAVDAGVPGAQEAWAKFTSRPVQPRGGVEPKWAILPWSENR
jgi:hypothetical protein